MSPTDDAASISTRRARAAAAGHTGDVAAAQESVHDDDVSVRLLGLSALARLHELDPDTLTGALADPDPLIRRRAAELAAADASVDLGDVLLDTDPRVVEMAAWAVGERPHDEDDHRRLVEIVTGHDDALCREAAVAALGSVGHPDGRAVILAALDDIATVRRRAVVALAPFDGADIDAALHRATDDRDWQVRQAAEDQLEG
ncbi:MAG: HEAT repeat domain-containing protein [Acidimicrobiales bacterium]